MVLFLLKTTGLLLNAIVDGGIIWANFLFQVL